MVFVKKFLKFKNFSKADSELQSRAEYDMMAERRYQGGGRL